MDLAEFDRQFEAAGGTIERDGATHVMYKYPGLPAQATHCTQKVAVGRLVSMLRKMKEGRVVTPVRATVVVVEAEPVAAERHRFIQRAARRPPSATPPPTRGSWRAGTRAWTTSGGGRGGTRTVGADQRRGDAGRVHHTPHWSDDMTSVSIELKFVRSTRNFVLYRAEANEERESFGEVYVAKQSIPYPPPDVVTATVSDSVVAALWAEAERMKGTT